jgi:septum formation protein
MPLTMPAIYLASRSPRRQALLHQLGVEFDLLRMREASGRDVDVVEEVLGGEPPLHYVERIARTKASVGWQRMQQRGMPERPVLAADTEVVLNGSIFGKPANEGAATEMLHRLSGQTHHVLTAVAVRWGRETAFAISDSAVSFRTLAPTEIANYIATGEPFDKAGGYAIQGRASAFIRELQGSYSGVMGLPLFETAELLAKIGFPVL